MPRTRVFIQPGQLKWGRFGANADSFGSGNGNGTLLPFGKGGGQTGNDPFATVPTQILEQWTELVAASGDIRNANVLSNPPWQPSSSVTLSNPVHIIGQDNIHSDDSANQSDAYAGSISYTAISANHVDFVKKLQFTINHQFLFSAFETGSLVTLFQFAKTASVIRQLQIKEGRLIGASGTNWTWTEDYQNNKFLVRMYGNNSGGAGNIKVDYVRNGVVLGSDTVPNSNGAEGAGVWFSILPHFFSRLGVQVFRLFAVRLQFFTH